MNTEVFHEDSSLKPPRHIDRRGVSTRILQELDEQEISNIVEACLL